MQRLVIGTDGAGSSPERVGAHASRASRAFTLIDVLVTIAVVGVLIAIMLPSLASVRETAHQIVCRSNVRQVGFGIELYAEANKGVVPYTFAVPSVIDLVDESNKTMTLRYGPGGVEPVGWDGLGLLYHDYLPASKIFYCPSHKGEHRFPTYSDQWRAEEGTIVGNFQYRGRGPTGVSTPRMTVRLDLIMGGAAIVADGLRTQSDFNHLIGANILRADLSVDWFNDSSRTVADLIPKDGVTPSANLQNIWQTFDHSSVR